MAHRLLFLVVILALIVGCGESAPTTPTEQGEMLLRGGHYDEAIKALTEAIRIDPSDASAYLHRGRAYQCREGSGDLDAAIADFTMATGLAPEDPEPYYSRSIAYRDRAEATRSEEDAQKSLEDQSLARRLDPRIREAFDALPDLVEPVAADREPAAREESADGEADASEPKTETSADVVRRLEARAAQEERERNLGSDGAGRPVSGSSSNRFGPDSGRANERPGREAAGARSFGLSSGAPSAPRESRSSMERRPSGADSLGGGPPTLTPGRSAASPTIPALPLSPLPGVTRSSSTLPPSATLPPVGNSPFSTPRPSQLGLPSPNAQPSGAAAPSPYQSPFPQAPPRPTGYVPPPVTGPANAQPRTFNPSGTVRTDGPLSVHRDDFRP